MVHPDLYHRFTLTEGAAVTGQVERKKGAFRLMSIDTLGGMEPEAFQKRKRLSDLIQLGLRCKESAASFACYQIHGAYLLLWDELKKPV